MLSGRILFVLLLLRHDSSAETLKSSEQTDTSVLFDMTCPLWHWHSVKECVVWEALLDICPGNCWSADTETCTPHTTGCSWETGFGNNDMPINAAFVWKTISSLQCKVNTWIIPVVTHNCEDSLRNYSWYKEASHVGLTALFKGPFHRFSSSLIKRQKIAQLLELKIAIRLKRNIMMTLKVLYVTFLYVLIALYCQWGNRV